MHSKLDDDDAERVQISIWSIWQELSSCDDHNNRNIHPVTIQITCEVVV